MTSAHGLDAATAAKTAPTPPSRPSGRSWSRLSPFLPLPGLAALPYGMILLIAGAIALCCDPAPPLTFLKNQPFGSPILIVSGCFFAAHLAVFVWRVVLFFMYRPAPPVTDAQAPRCTVIVPAYNEGPQVLETIRSIARSDYPAEKLDIIGVDDGSGDDTWQWLEAAALEFADQVTLVRHPVNQGKRHALYNGFKRGGGEIFITIDSDSQVSAQTLRHLVSPFFHNPDVGAVAGNVRILNRRAGLVPKMLEVAFAFSFDFLRAGQSVVNAVMCTPGALSAYRADIVAKVLPEWLHQRFCGRPANIGEDRAMTNLMLKNGLFVHYQRNATVHTNVPTRYGTLCKMLLRWARSNVRETLLISRFVFGKFRKASAWGLRVNVCEGVLNMTVGTIMRLAALGILIGFPLQVAPHMAMGGAVAACAPGLFYAFRHRSPCAIWALPYTFFCMVGLWWIPVYALLTPHKNKWLTRGAAAGAATEAFDAPPPPVELKTAA